MAAAWQATIVDQNGNVRPNALVEVKLESSGALASLFSDRDASVAIANPFSADDEGFARFYTSGGAYRVRAYNDSFERIWRHVSLGTFSEQDATQDTVGRLLYPQTSAETSAGVTPVNYAYPPGDVRRHGAMGDGSVDAADMYDALERAWDAAITAGSVEIYLPAGVYDVGTQNLPWRQDGVPSSLLDCNHVTIRGDGPQTVLKTTSVDGADVLQLNGLKNLTIRDLAITAEISGTVAGSNGISVTNGFDNINILDVWMLNLPSLDKTGSGDYIDGGKGLTIQTATTSNPCGTLNARIIVIGCAEGFGYEPDLVTAEGKDTCINVDLIAEDCHTAVKFVATAASGALSSSMTCGLTVRGQAINCQRDVAINRLHGGSIDMQVITTKTAAARRLDPNGNAWIAADTVVEALLCTYAHNARISVTGNKGGCDYKARIGAISAGSSGLTASTNDCEIYLDIGGTSVTADIDDVDVSGDTMTNTRLYASVVTATAFPTAFYATGILNTLVSGPTHRVIQPVFAQRILFAFGSDGVTESGRIDLTGNITRIQGKGTSSAGAPILGLYDQGGTIQWGIVNGGGVVIPAVGTGAALGAYAGKHPVYDATGALLGYFPIYA